MKKKIKYIQGKEVVFLTPESEEDLQKLNEMYKNEKIDPTDYFHGEQPKKKEQEKHTS